MSIKIIRCKECSGQARIYSRNNISIETSEFYCQCTGCGYRFVSLLTHKHAIENSTKDKITVFKDLLSSLSKTQIQAYKQALAEFETQ